MATASEKVVQFLVDKRPTAICDDCLARELGFKQRQRAYQITSVLGLTSDYNREQGICAHCKDTKLVTAHA